jgi:DNA-binding beta-propeller fold protein YncE
VLQHPGQRTGLNLLPVHTVPNVLTRGHDTDTDHDRGHHRRGARSAPPLTGAFLAPGSDPHVLPGPVLVADEDNNGLVLIDPQGRTLWVFPRPGDLAPGQTFVRPDDVFFTPDGTQIVATREESQVVSIIDIATRHIVFVYGTPGRPGSKVGQLSNPTTRCSCLTAG